jgi:hypothetical protein
LERLERDAELLQQRWGEALSSSDPFYNVNCSLAGASFAPGFPSRRRKPWLKFKERPSSVSYAQSRRSASCSSRPLSKCF